MARNATFGFDKPRSSNEIFAGLELGPAHLDHKAGLLAVVRTEPIWPLRSEVLRVAGSIDTQGVASLTYSFVPSRGKVSHVALNRLYVSFAGYAANVEWNQPTIKQMIHFAGETAVTVGFDSVKPGDTLVFYRHLIEIERVGMKVESSFGAEGEVIK